MRARIEFAISGRDSDIGEKTLEIGDGILDEILRYGEKLVSERMPRGVRVFTKNRYQIDYAEMGDSK